MQPQSPPPVPSIQIQKSKRDIIKTDEIWEIIDRFSLEDKEKIIERIFNQLPTECKTKIISRELGSNIFVVLSGNKISAEICFQIENARNLEYSDILEAVVRSRQRDRRS